MSPYPAARIRSPFCVCWKAFATRWESRSSSFTSTMRFGARNRTRTRNSSPSWRARGASNSSSRVRTSQPLPRAHRWNLEDAARRLRYAFFERIAQEGRATRIAVAHTADDQAETVLAHLFRGTGPAGLAGIYPLAGAVVRPLLRTRRQDLRRYLEGLGQAWCEDSTNRDLRRQRARIRGELLPVLERDFSPRIVRHLTELSRLSREEQIFWTALVEDRLRAFAVERDGKWTIRIPDLLSPLGLPGVPPLDGASQRDPSSPFRALTERLVRRLYEGVRGNRRELGAAHVEQVIHLATDSLSGRRI